MRSFLTRFFSIILLAAGMVSLVPIRASAANIMFSCWCQDTTTRTCNHHLIDTGVAEGASELTTAGIAVAPISVAGAAVVMLAGGVEIGVEDFLNSFDITAREDELRQTCRDRCAADGDRATHFETRYREEVCEECNPSPDSSCTEERGSRLAFGEAQTEQLIAACEERRSQSLLPVTLAVPIGGISQVAGLPDYINVAYRYLVTVVLVVAIVMVVYGGFRYLVGASLGDIQAGKRIIVDAIVGMLIVLGAHTILSTINPATTLLSFTPPEPVECRELDLPDAVKNARCNNDRDCGEGMRCVEAQDYLFSVENIAKATIEGAESGRETGAGIAESGGVLGFFGDGVTAGDAVLWGGPMGLVAALLSTDAVRESGVYEAGGAVLGGLVSKDTATVIEARRAVENIHLCSTGEQGSPCLEDQSCRAGLSCIESWGICWPSSGNQPGQPCDRDGQCANGSCVDVSGTDYKVCEIEVRDSTPCLRPNNGQSATVFPVACNGPPMDTEFVCVYCPSGREGEARNWTPLRPGDAFSAQCKPRSVLTSPTPCAR